MPALGELQALLRQETDNLREVDEILEMAPDSEDAIQLKEQVLERKKDLEDKIAKLSNNQTAPITSNKNPSPPSKPEEAQRIYKVGETVTAKYQGDGQFYPATIVSVMGSSTAPIYTIKFKGYEGTETVRGHQIRSTSHSNPLKRKADETVAAYNPPPAVPPSSSGSVLSAPASIDPELASKLKANGDGDAAEAGAEKPKKKKVNKVAQALEKQKSSWQDFQKKSAGSKVGKAVNKESMFRTGDNPLAKVGFVGSGAKMSADAVKQKYKYEDDVDGDRRPSRGGPPDRRRGEGYERSYR
ncbi:hypothetical protein KVT40_003431 [Elsinoe batatas]|uniref:Tudor domain-containing protein n=1 Tax=Elsinoe batatas TaxID=2601811 RepID=A0A8K0PH20_9PEZI|nr:hypothetical protein KVT40_003431 [Elsinoe batatas]